MTHQAVLLAEVVANLSPTKNSWYFDATFGAGGHTSAILNQGGNVVAFEYEHESYQKGLQKFATKIKDGQLVLIHANFAKLKKTLAGVPELATISFAGAIFDLGTSSDQLTSGEKGLSVYHDGPLDMRLDDTLSVTARDLLHGLGENELTKLFVSLGGEQYAKKIARAIKREIKDIGPVAFSNSAHLSDLVCKLKPRRHTTIHPATKVFQALRIAVNGEIANLEVALPQIWELLQPAGKLITISFHEGEDRPVKHWLQAKQLTGEAEILTKKPLQSSSSEISRNPRARSAKMRVAIKLN